MLKSRLLTQWIRFGSALGFFFFYFLVQAQTSPVQLISAQIFQGCSSCALFAGTVKVQNLAYQKQVTIFYKVGNSDWTPLEATYSSEKSNSVEDGWEVWEFESSKNSNLIFNVVEFYVKYNVNGQDYYDSSCQQNYKIYAPLQPIFGQKCQSLK